MEKVIGVYEIAERAGVTTGAVTNWIRRYAGDATGGKILR